MTMTIVTPILGNLGTVIFLEQKPHNHSSLIPKLDL